MFKVMRMSTADELYGVFIVSQSDEDRYLVTGTFKKRSEAEHFKNEFDRIVRSYNDGL